MSYLQQKIYFDAYYVCIRRYRGTHRHPHYRSAQNHFDLLNSAHIGTQLSQSDPLADYQVSARVSHDIICPAVCMRNILFILILTLFFADLTLTFGQIARPSKLPHHES